MPIGYLLIFGYGENNIPLYSTHSCVKFLRDFKDGGEKRFSMQATLPDGQLEQDQGQHPKYRLVNFFEEYGYTVHIKSVFKQKDIAKMLGNLINKQMRDLLANKLKIFYTAKYRLSDEDINPVTDELFELFTASDHSEAAKDAKINRCYKLENALQKLLAKLPPLQGKKEFQFGQEEEARIRGNEHMNHFIMDMAAIRMPAGWDRFGADYRMDIHPYQWIAKKEKKAKATEKMRPPETRPDISLSNDGKIGMVIEMKYEDEEEEKEKRRIVVKKKKGGGKQFEKYLIALKQIGENCYLQIFERDNACKKIIALGVSVNKSKQVNVGAIVREIGDKEDVKKFIERVSKELYQLDN